MYWDWGLSVADWRQQLAAFGYNRMEKGPKFSVLKLFWSQLTSPLMIVLIVALGTTVWLGDTVDGAVIALAVGMNAALGFIQEYKAERSLQALAEVVTASVHVVRQGVKEVVPVEEIVPGEVVMLAAGDKVPADGLVVRAEDLMINEAVLTGEAVPVAKQAVAANRLSAEARREKKGKKKSGFLLKEWTGLIADLEKQETKKRLVTVFGGTSVVAGEGVMVVLRTGRQSAVGMIASQLLEAVEEPTPLQRQLLKLSQRVAGLVVVVALGVFGAGYWRGVPVLEMFTVAVAVAVSAIPEGLVISLTAILAVGMQRIHRRKALVRKLLAAEVLGSVSVICTDKTGTLTEGMMKVRLVESKDKVMMARAAVATARGNDPLEEAFLSWARGYLRDSLVKWEDEEVVVDRWPFKAERRMAVALTTKEMYLVGAPEEVLGRSVISDQAARSWRRLIDNYGRQGYRLVAVAHRKAEGEKKLTDKEVGRRWYLLGLVVFADQVRPGLVEVIRKVRRAGMRMVMVTGDYAETAKAVWRQLGQNVNERELMEGEELAALTAGELDVRIGKIKLFARTTPAQKLLIVKAYKRLGEVVAMTGDGVNDAPALKRADMGIVVATAADVAKETADMVLLDNNFKTIVAAVEEGRGMFKNLRKVILYLLSDSFTEVLLVVGALVLGLPVPLTAAQILWVNLANDGFPGMALTVDPHLHDMLDQPPRKPDEPLLDKEISILISLISGVTAIVVLLGYWWSLKMGMSLASARTLAFTLLGVDSLIYVFSSRSMRTPLWKDAPWRNPWLLGAVGFGFLMQLVAIYVPGLQRLLKTEPLTIQQWGWVLGASGLVMAVIEGVKFFFWDRRLGGRSIKARG